MSKSIGKLLGGNYQQTGYVSGQEQNYRAQPSEVFGKTQQSYFEPIQSWGQSLYQKQNMSYLPPYNDKNNYSLLNVPENLQQTNDWKHKWNYAKNFVNDFKSGWNEGIDIGVENIINTASGGKYAELNQEFGGDYLSRKINIMKMHN